CGVILLALADQGEGNNKMAYSLWHMAYGRSSHAIRPSRRMRLPDWTGQYKASILPGPGTLSQAARRASEPYAICQKRREPCPERWMALRFSNSRGSDLGRFAP